MQTNKTNETRAETYVISAALKEALSAVGKARRGMEKEEGAMRSAWTLVNAALIKDKVKSSDLISPKGQNKAASTATVASYNMFKSEIAVLCYSATEKRLVKAGVDISTWSQEDKDRRLKLQQVPTSVMKDMKNRLKVAEGSKNPKAKKTDAAKVEPETTIVKPDQTRVVESVNNAIKILQISETMGKVDIEKVVNLLNTALAAIVDRSAK
jgi:hypothetical protein